MRRPTCNYCYRTSIATVLITTWFGTRRQWRHVCAKHIGKARTRG
jgi:hypothetical protein